WLWLARSAACQDDDRLNRLPEVVTVYREVLTRLAALGVDWVQLDEPALALDLPPAWRDGLAAAYGALAGRGPAILLATYFGGLGAEQLEAVCALPVGGLHLDGVRGGELEAAATLLPAGRVLSAGIIDGRNVWRTDL